MKHVRSVQCPIAGRFWSWASSGANAQENFLEKMFNKIQITKVLVRFPSVTGM